MQKLNKIRQDRLAGLINKTYGKLCEVLFGLLPLRHIEHHIQTIVRSSLKSLSPAESLRFLFRMDTFLYKIEGQKAVEYDGGIHTKHRQINYHNFFINHIDTNSKVLDIGCGNGALAYSIAHKTGASVVGIDTNEKSITEASKRFAHHRIKYIIGDALKDLPEMHFDVIVLSNVLEHFRARPAFLKELQLRIIPDRFLIRVPLFERDWRVPLKKELGVEWRLDATHEIEYTPESFKEEIKAAGMTINHQEIHWGEIWSEVCRPKS